MSAITVFVLRWMKDNRTIAVKAQAKHDETIEERIISNEEAGRKLRDELRADLIAAEAKIARLEADNETLFSKGRDQRLKIFELESELIVLKRTPPK